MRYFIYILTGAVIAVAIYAGVFYQSLGRATSRSAIGIDQWYQHKIAVAEKLPGNRLVIVSGSNGLYGVGARQIEDATGVPTVNFATHAGLSGKYLLYRAREVLRPGDTVLLPLEYELYFPSEANAVYTDYVISKDAKYFAGLPLTEQGFWIASSSFPEMMERLTESERKLKKIVETFREQTAGELNDRGDFIRNAKADQLPDAKVRVDRLTGVEPLLIGDWNETESGWREIEAFVKWCKENRIGVLATFPSTIYFKEYETGKLEVASKNIAAHYASMGVPVLGDPKAFMFERSDFFDTIYHLNREGAVQRTDRLLKLLEPHLNEIRSRR